MKTNKKIFQVVKSLIFMLSIMFFIGFMPAIASASQIPTPPLEAQVQSDGTFIVDAGSLPNPLTKKTVVRRAVLSLPPDTTGTIDSIIITGPTTAEPNGERVFGCFNTKVKNGTDLIKACGGTAVLLPGANLGYKAKGSGFEPNTKFQIILFDDFNGES